MSSSTIPKIIWQTHEWEYEDLPQNFLAASMTWQNLNPDWEYRYVGAKQREHYVKEADYLLYKIYKKHDKVSQADMWRYLVTHEFGGVYADMDSICTMPLTYLLDNHQNGAEMVATPENGGFVFNSNFAVVPSSKIMKRILEHLVTYYERTNWIHLFMSVNNEEEFWEQFAIGIKLHPGLFADIVVRELPELVSFNFTAFIHETGIKTSFDYDFPVNYYGKETSYFKLAKEHGWETHMPSFRG